MTTISPSILSADFSHLGADCRMVLDAGAQMLHYDVMDGHFVPNISFGVPVLKSLHKALPDAFYDVHLMITHPQQYAEAFAKAGASLYNFHLECDDDIQETIDAIKAQGCKVGMTIKPGTPVEELGYYLDQLDLVLVMSVEPGFGGQSFMADMMEKTRFLREKLDEVKTYAAMAYTALGCEGLARCDFFVEHGTNRVMINEINTFPGFTSISMYPKLMEHEGLPVPQLIDRLIALAVERTEKQHG